MIPKECKRLAEVDFPIAEVSKHSAREKSIRHGHPSTLHLWWARRPLASCRAVLLGLLLPDPCDPLCPRDFKAKARELLPKVLGSVGAKDEDLRKALLRFIADFANWDLAANKAYLEAARALVKAAYREESPLVVDPFAGGGSIPLEALRLGCEAFASDLNPVACLILKTMLEHIPRHGPQLAEELRRVGGEIKKQAEKELADLYPKDADGATPIAYLWARTVRCEAPNCGAEIPLVRSFWLCKKPKRKRALRYEVHHRDTESTEKIQKHSQCPQCLRGEFPHVEFEIFEPKSERDVPEGTVSRARAKCLCCGTVLPPERVRAQLAAQRGGADVVFHHRDRESTEKNCEETSVSSVPLWCRTGGARLLAVVTLRHGVQGRHYRLPTERDYEAVRKAQVALAKLLDDWESNGRQGLCPVPDEPIHAADTRNFWVCKYGPQTFGDLFTARQKLALVTLSRLVRELTTETQRAQRDSLKEAVRLGMMCAFGIFARSCNTGARLRPDATVAPAFGMHALPMNWGFPETILWGGRSEHFDGAIDTVLEVVEGGLGRVMAAGHVQLADATEHPLPDDAATVWFTDPPYYDAVPYADLSDFFFVWLKRALAGWKPALPFLRDPFDPANPLVPKLREAVQNERSETAEGRAKDKAFYEEAMARAFAEGRRLLREDGVGGRGLCPQDHGGMGSAPLGHDKGRLDHHRLLAHRHRDGFSATCPRVGGARHERSSHLPAQSGTGFQPVRPAGCRSHWRLGQCPARAAPARRGLDGAAPVQGHPRGGSRLRLYRPCAGDFQPVQPGRDRRWPGGQAGRVLGEGVGGRRACRLGAGARGRQKSKGKRQNKRSRRGI